MLHNRHVSSVSRPHPSPRELSHYLQGIIKFKQALTEPLSQSQRDALWITTTLLEVITLGSIEATCPEEAWPIKTSEMADDLNWMFITQVKGEMWRIADVANSDCSLRELANKPWNYRTAAPPFEPGFKNISPFLIRTLTIDSPDNPHTEAYRSKLRLLDGLMIMRCDQSTILYFLSFLSRMSEDCTRLLQSRDPGALMIMAYWYAKTSQNTGQWWIHRRSILECQSICLYLERYHGDIPGLQAILAFPKRLSAFAAKRLRMVSHR